MNIDTLFELFKILLFVILGGAAIYFKTTTKLNQKVNTLIAKAEEIYQDTTKSGGKKFFYVVDALYRLLPAPLQLILPKSLIETIVQNTFNAMEKYAVTQLDNHCK